jgi:hypothetical protein
MAHSWRIHPPLNKRSSQRPLGCGYLSPPATGDHGPRREPQASDDRRGGYRRDGDLRLHSDRALIGWCSATEGRVRSLGALFLVVGGGGAYLSGRWVGTARDGLVVTGWRVLACDSDRATSVMTHLLVDGRP